MKRFKDCKLECIEGQTPMQLLYVVKDACSCMGEDVEVRRFDEEYNTLVVSFASEGNPCASLVLYARELSNCIAVINAFPDKRSGINELNIDSYNAILHAFSERIFVPISQNSGNTIKEGSDEYDIADVIPKSYKKLEIWLSNYPLSGHVLDRNRWYDFVIAMYRNHESIDPFDFRDYLINVVGWSETDAENTANKLEEQLNLLGYYAI